MEGWATIGGPIFERGREDDRVGRRQKSRPTRANRHVDLTSAAIPWTEEAFYERLEQIDVPFLLVLDRVQDPHNLGACLRTADAAGVHAIIAPKIRAVALTETVRRIACGAAENVPFVQVTNLARTLGELQGDGVRVIGTADGAEHTIFETDLTGPLAIVMGFEGAGLRRLTEKTCDDLVKIPMCGTVDCLNVSVATGVCLFEAVRQRQ